LSLLNWRAQEESRFTLLSNQGPFEVRLYQRMLSARISVTGSFEEALGNGISHLNDYLEGNNFKVDRIENYGPYFQIHKVNHWEIGIILPTTMNASNAPKPINRLIKIEEISPGRVGVLRFKGQTSRETFHRRGEELKKWLNYKGLNAPGPVRISRHDLTIPLPFFRHNEVHMDISG
jgi:hypothetical protein